MGLKIEHIYKQFGKQLVLKDVSFSMQDGEIVGLLGPNGAGKSTLMKILVGLVKPDRPAAPVRSGTAALWDRFAVRGETAGAVGSETAGAVGSETAGAVRGETAGAVGPAMPVRSEMVVDVPERVGYLPEQNPLYEDMYVREYLKFIYDLTIDDLRFGGVQFGKLRGGLRYDPERVEELIRRVGLTPEAHKKIGQLSKGYKQRVGLAQALLSDPDLLVLDEPTTGLDPNQLVEIRRLIKQIGRDRMVILSTHILSEVKEISDRVVVLDHGEIKANRSIDEITDLEEMFQELTIGR